VTAFSSCVVPDKTPEPLEELSSKRLLTMTWLEGRGLMHWLDESQETRNRIAELLFKAWWGPMTHYGVIHGDPHLGNYALTENAEGLQLLDFGCVQESSEETKRMAVDTHLAATRGDIEAFERAAAIMMDMRGGEYQRNALGYIRSAFAPVLQSPYKIEREYVVGLAAHIKQVFDSARKAKDDAYVPFPEGMIFFNRLQFGFYSVLARLDVEVDYARVEREFLDPDRASESRSA